MVTFVPIPIYAVRDQNSLSLKKGCHLVCGLFLVKNKIQGVCYEKEMALHINSMCFRAT